jgi:hypothetical protein
MIRSRLRPKGGPAGEQARTPEPGIRRGWFGREEAPGHRFARDSPLREVDSNHRSLATSLGSRQENAETLCRCLPAGYPTVRRCGDVRFRALVKGSMAWLPMSPCGPSLILGVELPLDAFLLTRPKAGLSARDQRFECVSLQGRVCLCSEFRGGGRRGPLFRGAPRAVRDERRDLPCLSRRSLSLFL